MSIEGFNAMRSSGNKKETLAGFMTATEARKQLDDAVAKLAADEVAKALANVKDSIAKGDNIAIYCFDYGVPKEVINAAIAMLKDLQYRVTVSERFHDIIHIKVQ